jgi:hypothetical protein
MQLEPGHHQTSVGIPDELARPRDLWAAVMHGAVNDLLGQNSTTKGRDRNVINTRLSLSARLWFESDARGIGSFLWICSVLELDPEKVRGQLRAPPE